MGIGKGIGEHSHLGWQAFQLFKGAAQGVPFMAQIKRQFCSLASWAPRTKGPETEAQGSPGC